MDMRGVFKSRKIGDEGFTKYNNKCIKEGGSRKSGFMLGWTSAKNEGVKKFIGGPRWTVSKVV